MLDRIVRADGHRLVRDLPANKARKIIEEIGVKRPGMANLTRAVMRRVISFAINMGLRTDNPFDGVPQSTGSARTILGRMIRLPRSRNDGRSGPASG